MATDENVSEVEDWVVVREEEELQTEQECGSIGEYEVKYDSGKENECEDGFAPSSFDELGLSNNPEPEQESDSFSVLSSLADSLSHLSSVYDGLGENISITAGIRCYTHFRNQRLNKTLDFLLTLAFTLVAGLAIGNFIGLSENCKYEKFQLARNCTLNATSAFQILSSGPDFVSRKVLDDADYGLQKLSENDVLPMTSDRFSLVAVSFESLPMHHWFDSPSHEETPGEYTSANSAAGSTEIPEQPSAGLGEDQQENSGYCTLCNESGLYKNGAHIYADLLRMQNPNLKSFGPPDVIQYLHSTVDEVMHKAADLTLKIPTEMFHSHEDLANVERTRSAFSEFTHTVKKTLDELSGFVRSVDLRNEPQGNRYFLKTASLVVKSVDTLMKNIFEEALLKKQRSLKSRLKAVQHICYDVIKKFHKKMKEQRKYLKFKQDRNGYYKKTQTFDKQFRSVKDYRKDKEYKEKYYSHKPGYSHGNKD